MVVRESTGSRPRAGLAKAHLALFDATTPIAKGVKEQLIARSFPIASMRLFTSTSDPENNLTEFGGEAMLITVPDADALGSIDIAFLCGGGREAARYLDWPGRKGFVAIDLTTVASEIEGVPLVNAGVNPEAIAGRAGLIATPHPIAQMLSSLLAPIVRGCGMEEAVIVVFQPASQAGDEGIEELYQQAVGLLNFHELPRKVFGRQLAFNLIPSFLRDGEAAGGIRPAALVREVRRVTGGDYGLSVEVVQAPVFHCHAVLAHLRPPSGIGRADLLSSLKGADGIEIAADGGPVTPVERAGKQGMLVSGLRPSQDRSSIWIWAVNDNLTSGTAQNAVRIAEALLERGRA